MQKALKISVSLLFGAAVMLFWALVYPQALGFREQNQIFFYTWDYVAGKLSLAGGFADLIASFVSSYILCLYFPGKSRYMRTRG